MSVAFDIFPDDIRIDVSSCTPDKLSITSECACLMLVSMFLRYTCRKLPLDKHVYMICHRLRYGCPHCILICDTPEYPFHTFSNLTTHYLLPMPGYPCRMIPQMSHKITVDYRGAISVIRGHN